MNKKQEKKIDLMLEGINLLVISNDNISKHIQKNFNKDFYEVYLKEENKLEKQREGSLKEAKE